MTATLAAEPFARRLRGFGPIGIAAIAIILLSGSPIISAALVLLWVQLSHTPWREIGYVRPKSWAVDSVIGIVFGIALKFLMKAIVMPLIGGEAVNPAYHYLEHNPAALPAILLSITVGAGWAEETVYRGFLFERLHALLGRTAGATTAIVVLTSAWFALVHYPGQGVFGVEQAIFTGLAFGATYAVTRRLWLVMVAHVAFDVTAVAMIYWGVETRIAHWVVH